MPPVPFAVRPIPLFTDNYAWRIDLTVAGAALVVDPADPAAVMASFAGPDAPELLGVLTTHHHWDHAGGNQRLAVARPGIEIVAGAAEAGNPAATSGLAATRLVHDGETFEVAGSGLSIKALHTPCHTQGHVCYFIEGSEAGAPSSPQRALFSGDTLFQGGCGRFFEGDAAQMHASLAKIKVLPADTALYSGHEYTVANLRFCMAVEPGNAATAARLEAAAAARSAGRPTQPSTLADELETNVFLRTHVPEVQAFCGGLKDPVAVLAALREAKNAFKG